jgi:hypothetical protein
MFWDIKDYSIEELETIIRALNSIYAIFDETNNELAASQARRNGEPLPEPGKGGSSLARVRRQLGRQPES